MHKANHKQIPTGPHISPEFSKALLETKEDIRKEMNLHKEDFTRESASASEIFDSKYRTTIWNNLLDYQDQAPEYHKQAVLKEIIKLDLKLFRDFFKFNSKVISETQNKKSSRLIENFKSAKYYQAVAESDEYKDNQRLNFEMLEAYENVLNYFYLVEFYIAPKLKHKKKIPQMAVWSFGMVLSSFMLKSMGCLVQACAYGVDLAFANPTLTKQLASLCLVAYLGFHPSFLLASQSSKIYTIALPFIGKFLRWCGIFTYLNDVLTMRDTTMYITATNESLKKTLEVLSELKLHVAQLTDDFLNHPDTEDSELNFFKKMDEAMKKFGSGYGSLEDFIDKKTNIKLITKEDENGWNIFETEAKIELEDIKSSIMTKTAIFK